jgi:hypothetical protein
VVVFVLCPNRCLARKADGHRNLTGAHSFRDANSPAAS